MQDNLVDPRKKRSVTNQAIDAAGMGMNVQDPNKVAELPMPAPHVAGPAPGSSLYQNDPSNAPPQKSFQDVSGIDPYAPIRQIMKAQEEQNAANQELARTQAMGISPVRGILGSLAGAAIGAISPRNAEQGAELGSAIVNGPKNKAMGLAARRAANAQAQIESAKDLGGVIDKSQGQYTAERGETRLEQHEANANDQAERENYAPTEIPGGDVIQAPKLAPKPGQAPRAPVVVGHSVPKVELPKPEYRADANGNLYAITVGSDGKPNAQLVPGADGKPIQMPPEKIDDFKTYIDNFRKANPKATPKQENDAIEEFRKSGSISLDVAGFQASRADTRATAVSDIVARVSRQDDVQAAFNAKDPNKYMQAVDGWLSKIQDPTNKKYILDVRNELLKSLPKTEKGSTGIDAEINKIINPNQPPQ